MFSWFLPALFDAPDGYEAVRQRMVRVDIEARGVRSAIVLEAMRSTARHLFVPAPLRYLAYADRPLPIGHGQTISQPYVVAFMTELLDPQPHHRALEIGTGCGYQAAVLSRLVKAVYTIEIVPELARDSAALLQQLGYQNVFVRAGAVNESPGQVQHVTRFQPDLGKSLRPRRPSCRRRQPKRSAMPSSRNAATTTSRTAPAFRPAARRRCNACRRT